MNRVRNSKIKFKVLLVILATALISGGVLQSSLAMQDDRDMYATLKETDNSNNINEYGNTTEKNDTYFNVTDTDNNNNKNTEMKYNTEMEQDEFYGTKPGSSKNEVFVKIYESKR